MNEREFSGTWGLILGASSGFGAASAVELARRGMNIVGVHLDRKATLPAAEQVLGEVRAQGVQARFFNVNAADDDRRREVVEATAEAVGEARPLRLLLHSLAFGTLKPFIAPTPREAVRRSQLEMTLDVMAHSLVYWTQDLVAKGLIGQGSRVLAMTSSGGTRVMPFYGPVSAAKAALESHIRQLALELGPLGATANAVRAGVTDTPALRAIPAHEVIMNEALRRNPGGRLTRPEDVARAIVLLCRPEAQWASGNVIGVDGGEDIVA